MDRSWTTAQSHPEAGRHSTYAITMNRYGHLFPSEDHATAIDKIVTALYAKKRALQRIAHPLRRISGAHDALVLMT
jgi:hypothetical protein